MLNNFFFFVTPSIRFEIGFADIQRYGLGLRLLWKFIDWVLDWFLFLSQHLLLFLLFLLFLGLEFDLMMLLHKLYFRVRGLIWIRLPYFSISPFVIAVCVSMFVFASFLRTPLWCLQTISIHIVWWYEVFIRLSLF